MEPSPELRGLTQRIIQAANTGDVDFLARHVSSHPGVGFLGTAPDEWWTDLAGLSQAVVAQQQAGVTVDPGDPVAYQEGDMGWAVDRALRFRAGDQEGPLRFTAVYRREDGAWKMVHFHTSFGIPNAEALGVDLPT